MTSPLLLFHTVRYLKARQIVGRVQFHLRRPRPVAVTGAVARSRTQPIHHYLRASQSLFTDHEAALASPLVRLLGDEMVLDTPSDWNRADKAKLFLYNVHYFDDLNAEGCEQRQAMHDELIERWIRENPAPHGNGWESYPLSLRIVNWIKYFSRAESVPQHWLDSLASQAHYLSRHLEYHLLGNHLFTNAKALVFAGCFLENQDKLLGVGLGILRKEMPRQILSDGGHFELSPMYHCIAMADLMDLISLGQSYPEQIPDSSMQEWSDILQGMFLWLERMCHPDGQISLFNDAAMGIAPDLSALSACARALNLTVPTSSSDVHHASNSGYVTLHTDTVCCMLDIGRIGPDYIPGHAHADSLGFELSLHGQRLICDSGTSVYGAGTERLRQRGTEAHNTVLIDQQNSSEVWSGFRVARRARPVNVSVEETAATLNVSAAHDGYRRLPGKNIHHRHWSIDESSMTIVDTVSGKFNEACALFHLHPSVRVKQHGEYVSLQLPSGHEVRLNAIGGRILVEPSTWHPRFGEAIPSNRLRLPFDGATLQTTVSWKTDNHQLQ